MISLKKNTKTDMSNFNTLEASQEENLHSQFALQVAFQTMKERCQHLQARLVSVEEENIRLRLECGKEVAAIAEKSRNDSKDEISILKEKVEELTKQKSQLNHHIFMVAAENRQLWNRLSRLTRANKSLGNQLTKISDTLKKHPITDQSDILSYSFKGTSIETPEVNKCLISKDGSKEDKSLEEISLRLINSIMLEKCELEKQYAEMVELQSDSQVNLQKVGFTYPEDVDTDSLEQLKTHDSRLSQTKEILLSQQARLKRILAKFKALKNGTTCQKCRKNASKILCQTGTQIDLDSIKETHTMKPIMSSDNLSSEISLNSDDNNLNKTCPLCGESYGKSFSFTEFHEHVLSHFSNEDMEVVH